jgi:hypothetical protein
MCIHPEALDALVKNFSHQYDNGYHTVHQSSHRLPEKGYWVVRESSYYRPKAKEHIGEVESTSPVK